MSTALDWIAGGSGFEHGRTITRLRPGLITDPYSEEQVRGDWDNPEVLTISGAFVAQSSTSMTSDATRAQALEAKSLYCAPGTDVQPGDRIRDGADLFDVDGFPSADVNPFTNWQPVMEVPLTRTVG